MNHQTVAQYPFKFCTHVFRHFPAGMIVGRHQYLDAPECQMFESIVCQQSDCQGRNTSAGSRGPHPVTQISAGIFAAEKIQTAAS